jgi:hypothetical protein
VASAVAGVGAYDPTGSADLFGPGEGDRVRETVNVIVGVFVILCFLAAFAWVARPREFRRQQRVPHPNRRSSDRKSPPA